MTFFSEYLDSIARANGLGNLPLDWLFYPGMLQDSTGMWWADFGTRHAAHEGIDICFYRNGKGTSALPPGARVPAAASGTLLNISSDLMGKSLVVSLDNAAEGGAGRDEDQPVLVYSHLSPDPGLAPGDRISKGDILAATFDARTIKSRLLSHLHLSCVLIPAAVDKGALDWGLFADRERVTYINPVFL
ncbi:MAG: hypothetical protein HUN04_05375 [Desulfobacter sp.]|nr:MAG: hypothetical protein HUN04_05375 [Desulfobacter sp.]